MRTPQRRVELLNRLARLREVEKQAAAQKVAEAQGTHGKLLALQERSGEIAASYATRTESVSGDELARRQQFLAGLEEIRRQTKSESRKAEEHTREAMSRLQAAERRREVTSEKLGAERRAAEIALAARDNPVLARKLKGAG
ncbi:hypothetical protein [Alteraurantiacibacter aquimixticola]|uniref:Flagellar FliJ protein n=1 Tax=Alteraurantiacibacter aquimixticola TaxID=2489173 RepID=A0A4T3F754_9SPHN|nr:hypothetical protein [Alteraurantiacibacter aquimixticola]TIX51532.1 hypothetical protein E5222_03505 [Alteraurantiacibacter aquimixticola]